jgi:hypothetical protein
VAEAVAVALAVNVAEVAGCRPRTGPATTVETTMAMTASAPPSIAAPPYTERLRSGLATEIFTWRSVAPPMSVREAGTRAAGTDESVC